MNSLYILVLVIYIQPYNSTLPTITNIPLTTVGKASIEECMSQLKGMPGEDPAGVSVSETDSVRQFAWRDFKCVSLESK